MKTGDVKILQGSSAIYQFIAAIVGWSGPNISLLMSDESPLPTGKITIDEVSWTASYNLIDGTIGTVIFGYITNKFGRKMPLILLSIPIIISWVLILFAQNVYYLYAGRFINGFAGGGVFVIAPLFVAEIAHDRVRGILGSITVLSIKVGILLAFVIGGYCDYYTTPLFSIVAAAVFGVWFTTFPESPLVLLKQHKITEAENSIKFYQNLRDDKQHFEMVQTEIKKLQATDASNGEPLNWSDFGTNPGKKGLIIGFGAAILSQCCGIPALLAYTTTIFEKTGSSISPNAATIIVGIVQVFGALIATNFVDRGGRKYLYVTSTIGTGLSFSVLGTYMMFQSMGYAVETYNWIPIVSFSSILLVGAWGTQSLPFVLISEVLPEKMKNLGATMCLVLIWFFGFVVVKFLPLLNETLNLYGSMFLFAGICFTSALVIILFLPETKGKSYEEIMKILR